MIEVALLAAGATILCASAFGLGYLIGYLLDRRRER